MKKMSNWVAVFVSLITGSQMASAQQNNGLLSAPQVRALFFGQTMTGEYSDGQSWAEQFGRDGNTRYSQNGQVFHGKMKLQGSNICFEYAPDTGFTGGCFEVWKRGANCFDFYSTTVDGFAAATASQKHFGQAWSARAWYPDRKSTCTTDQIS